VNPGETHAVGVRGEIGGSATALDRRGGCAIKRSRISDQNRAGGVMFQ
jgi:hypothetical protein